MRVARLLAPAFCALLLVSCARSGSGSDSPLYRRDGADTVTPTPAAPDADGDGVPDSADACPDAEERPGGVDAGQPDGCPDTLDDLVQFAADDIDTYWRNRLRGISVGYVEPHLAPYTEETATGCGPTLPDNATYCPFDNTISWDEGFLQREFDEHGDFAPILILAHEWGHLVQAQLGFFALDHLYGIDYELQADCMAGVYARSADQRDLLALDDLDAAAATLLSIGDNADDVAWYSPNAHGTGEERTHAFMQGFEQGLGVCGSVADEAKDR